MIEIEEDLQSEQTVKKRVHGGVVTTEKKNVEKNVKLSGELLRLQLRLLFLLLLPLLLLLLFQKIGRGMQRARRGPGEQKKNANLFVALNMKQMKMDGPLYDVNSKTKQFKQVF